MISIRPACADDAVALNRIYNQPGVRRFTSALPFTSLARTQAVLVDKAGIHASLVACGPDGAVLGQASLRREANPRRAYAATLGIMVDETAQRQGIGSALLAALLDLADHWLNLHKIELTVFANNEAAIALYKRFGFITEAVLRHEAMQEGVLRDALAMGRLRQGLPRDASPPPPRPPQAPRAPFSLRAPMPDDLPGLAALCSLPGICFGTTGRPFMTPRDVAHLVAPESGAHAILALSGEVVAGLAVLTPGRGRHLHAGTVESLLVHDAYQGQGIGRALLSAVLELADCWLGLSRVALAVLADQEHAIRLYESFGFEVEGRFAADIFRGGAYADSLAMARLR